MKPRIFRSAVALAALFLLSLSPAIEVEAYDLRGKGYSDPQIASTAKAYSKDKLVVLVRLNKEEKTHQEKILDIVRGNMHAGYTKVMVIFADQGEHPASIILIAKGAPIPRAILISDKLYELDLSIGIQSTYKHQYGQPQP